MRANVVAYYLGMLVCLLGAFMLLPAAVSAAYGEPDVLQLLLAGLATMGVGILMWLVTRRQPGPMARKESFLVVALGWVLASAFGAIPYILTGSLGSYVDAYFETMSGFTTTGASVFTDIEIQSHGILFWRDLTQWLGGMGIIVLFVALLPLTRVGGAGASALVEDEAPAPQVDRVTPRIRDTAKALWITYLAISVVEVVLLLLGGMPLFDSITNTFGTMATGGFAPRNASIAHYRSAYVDVVITLFMVLAGANFGLYYLIWKGKVRRALADTEFRVYLAILGGVSAIITVDLMLNSGYASLTEALRFSTFQVVSLQTTTGFATADFDQWTWFSKSLLLFVIFVGASSGSTGGALKVIRFVVITKYAHRALYQVFHPRVVLPIRMGGRALPDTLIRESIAFFILYQSIFLFSVLAITALGIDFVTAFSSVAVTVGNVGPGLGLVGPIANYAWAPDLAKIIWTFDMYVGRLELWTVLILFRPSFWRET